MQPTFEQVVKTIESLSEQDYERLWQWMREKRRRQLTSETNKGKDSVLLNKDEWREIAKEFRLALRWIDEHRQEYLGQWVCLDGDKLISFGTDALKVQAEAKAVGIKIPFIDYVGEEEGVSI